MWFLTWWQSTRGMIILKSFLTRTRLTSATVFLLCPFIVLSFVSGLSLWCTDDAMFQPIPVPGRHDWLTDHREDGQTFHQFVKGNMRSPDSKRSKIYFLPVSFSANDKLPADILDLFVKFASSFFCMKVSVLRQADCLAGKIGQRVNSYTKKLQVSIPRYKIINSSISFGVLQCLTVHFYLAAKAPRLLLVVHLFYLLMCFSFSLFTKRLLIIYDLPSTV